MLSIPWNIQQFIGKLFWMREFNLAFWLEIAFDAFAIEIKAWNRKKLEIVRAYKKKTRKYFHNLYPTPKRWCIVSCCYCTSMLFVFSSVNSTFPAFSEFTEFWIPFFFLTKLLVATYSKMYSSPLGSSTSDQSRLHHFEKSVQKEIQCQCAEI